MQSAKGDDSHEYTLEGTCTPLERGKLVEGPTELEEIAAPYEGVPGILDAMQGDTVDRSLNKLSKARHIEKRENTFNRIFVKMAIDVT